MTDQFDQPMAVQKTEEQTSVVTPPVTEEVPTDPQTQPEGAVAPQVEAPELPEGSEEQRRAFQEMRLENKRLKEEMEARVKTESAFDAFRPKQVTSQLDPNQFTDQVTGEFDWARYNQQVITQANQTATVQANQAVDERLDEFQARTKFPEVFSDKESEQEVADRWFAARMRGETPSISDIAKKVASRISKTVSKAEELAAEKVLSELTPKEQASLSAQSVSSAQTSADISVEAKEASLSRVRRGDDLELAKLMSKFK